MSSDCPVLALPEEQEALREAVRAPGCRASPRGARLRSTMHGYMRERKQFGKPIAEFQGPQFMIADMAMKLEAARQLTYAAAARSDRAMAGERIADLALITPDLCGHRPDPAHGAAQRPAGV